MDKPRRKWAKPAIVACVVLVGSLGIRQAVAGVYYVPLASMEPELPRGSRVLVYKLAGSFRAGDIVAFRHTSGETHLGRFEGEASPSGTITVSRNGSGPIDVPMSDVIGRVVLSTR